MIETKGVGMLGSDRKGLYGVSLLKRVYRRNTTQGNRLNQSANKEVQI